MTREELRDYVEEQRSLNMIPYHVYSTLIDGIDTLEQEPCDDCISREQAIKQCGFGMTSLLIADNLRRLPPVTPQTRKGHWIVAKGGSYLGMRNACCSNCRDFYTNDWAYMNYCPNCGAKMVELQKSEG